MTAHQLNITEWSADSFKGASPKRQFLVEGLFPMGCASILAAQGDTGKGMMLLDLALKVASYDLHKSAFGPEVLAHGTAIIFSAEDDADEIHRRLNSLDPLGQRFLSADKLLVVPLPNIGGPFPIAYQQRGELTTSAEFQAIKAQLTAIPDVKLIVFDPLSSFMAIDINTDPAMGSFATNILAHLATRTGAAVIVAHHMRKTTTAKGIETPEQAREAVRGTSALIDGVRFAYAIWSPSTEYQDAVCTELNQYPQRNQIYQGAVIKSNGPADRLVRTYCRADNGLLQDITQHVIDAHLEVVPKTKRKTRKPA